VNRYWKLLRERDYALLWGGATVSALGDGMSFVALVWLVIERGGTAADIGWLSAAYTAPVIVGGIAAALVAQALLIVVPGAVGLWIPALGRGPTAEPAVPQPATGPAAGP